MTTAARPRRPLVRYLAVAFTASWLVAVPLALAGLDLVPWSLPAWLHGLVSLGPALGALAALHARGGWHDVAVLLRRLAPSSIPSAGHWVLALSPLLLAVPVVAVVAVVADPDWTAVVAGDSYEVGSWPVAVFVVSLAFGVFEELGWRGFLLPWWQEHHSAAGATWRVWLAWAAWHLPMFGYHFEVGAQSLGWVVSLYFGAVWLAFLFNATGGSLAAVATWHATYNVVAVAGGALSPVVPVAVSVAVVAAAVVVGRRFGPEDLAPRSRATLAATTPARTTSPAT